MAISGFPSSLEREKRARLRQRLLLIYPEKAKGRGSKSLRVPLFIAIWILSLSLSSLRSKRMAASGIVFVVGKSLEERERERWMWLDGKKYSSRKKVSKREALVSDRERSSMQMKGAGEGALICR